MLCEAANLTSERSLRRVSACWEVKNAGCACVWKEYLGNAITLWGVVQLLLHPNSHCNCFKNDILQATFGNQHILTKNVLKRWWRSCYFSYGNFNPNSRFPEYVRVSSSFVSSCSVPCRGNLKSCCVPLNVFQFPNKVTLLCQLKGNYEFYLLECKFM